MVCRNCGQETRGIKINQKLFCTNCGEAILDIPIPVPIVPSTPAVQETPDPIASTSAPIPKIISKDGQETKPSGEKRGIDLLEAEEEVIKVLEKQSREKVVKKNKPKKIRKRIVKDKKEKRKKTNPIIKHNRKRTDRHNKKDFLMVPNEPDPIKEPELMFPHDDQIEASKGPELKVEDAGVKINLLTPEADTHYPLVDKEKLKNIKERQQRHTKALTSFLKSGASQTSKKIIKKKKKMKRWKMFLIVGVPSLLIGSFIGLVLYVNFYGNKAAPVVENAESIVSFTYKKPGYIPVGYELTYQTAADSNSISYDYNYLPSTNKKLKITISKTEVKASELYEKIINPLNKEYLTETKDNIELWLVGDNSLYFISNNLLYEVISSDKMPREELIKIADGLL